MGWQDAPITPQAAPVKAASGWATAPLASNFETPGVDPSAPSYATADEAAAALEPKRISTGDWRTQRYESTLPGGRKSVVTSPSDLAGVVDAVTGFPKALGKSSRATMEGLASLFQLAQAPLNYGIDKGLDLVDPPTKGVEDLITGAPAHTNLPRLGPAPNLGTEIANGIGLPNAENPTEEMIMAGTRGAAGAVTPLGVSGVLAKAASPVVAGVGEILSQQPGLQLAAGGTGAMTGEAVKQSGGSETEQMIGSLLGGGLPFAIEKGPLLGLPVFKGGREIVRGGESGAENMRKNIADFEGAGDFPTVGQATENPALRGMESAASVIPGSNLNMLMRAKEQSTNIGNKLNETITKLAPEMDDAQVGTSVVKGITESYKPKAAAVQSKLYDKVDSLVDPKAEVPTSNLRATLEKLAAPSVGAEETSGALSNRPAIQKILDKLNTDQAGTADRMGYTDATSRVPDKVTAPGVPPKNTLPYEALKGLRSDVGEMLGDYKLDTNISRGNLKQIYGALSEDMKSAVKAAGPKAESAFNRANKFTKDLHDNYDVLDSVIANNGGPEGVLNSLYRGTKQSGFTIQKVMQAVPKDSQKALAASIFRRMGAALKGQAVAEEKAASYGENFSTQTFLSNWNDLSDGAKKVLTTRFGSDFKTNMDQVARVASNIREGSKIYANPSGTAGKVLSGSAGIYVLGQLVRGNLGEVGATVAAAGTGYGISKAFTSPTVVKWLAQSTKKPYAALPALVNQLSMEARKQKDEDAAAFAEHLKTQLANPPQNP